MVLANRETKANGAGRVQGGSEMAERVRKFGWETTPLKSMGLWSDSVISAVNFVLASPVSTILMVGPSLITLYNDAYIPTLAERHPAALGMPGDVLWSDAWAAVGHQIEAVNRNGEAFRFENVLIPVVRNGVLTDTYFSYSFSPIFESNGDSVAGVMCMAQDVTAAHQLMLDLAASERHLAVVAGNLNQVMAATKDAVVSVNRQWELVYMNSAAEVLYGKASGLIGRNLWEAFPDAVYEGSPLIEHYYRAMNERIGGSFEAEYGPPLNLTIGLEVYPSEVGIVTFSRDITQLKHATEAVLRNEKLAVVGRLASTVAHEINNPLEAVTNLIYLSRISKTLEEAEPFLNLADAELRRAAAIVSRTLRFHRQASRPTAITFAQFLDGIYVGQQSRLRNSQIDVQERDRAALPVTCMEGEIRQVLVNLVGNAIDAMHGTGGTLFVRGRNGRTWATGEPGLVITIADTGGGMSEITKSRLFEAFYSTKGISGTGLGLWVSKEIVDRHEGSLQVRSSQRPLRSGTVFRLFLPFGSGQGAS